MESPRTQYALRDDIHIGYQVWGGNDGAVDLLELSAGLMISIDETVDEPNWLRYTERLARFSRLVRFDPHGLGLSDPLAPGTEPTVEDWGRDALAVMDAAGCERAVLLGPAGGALPAIWLAAAHPERVASVVLVNGTARVAWDEGYDVGVPGDMRANVAATFEDMDGPAGPSDEIPQDIVMFAPSLAHRVGFQEWWGRAARRGASPATAIAWNLTAFLADVRSSLPGIGCPVLVLARTDTFGGHWRQSEYLAQQIEGARFVSVPGTDILPWAGEFDSIVDEIEEFVTGGRGAHLPTRMLATVLFTDIVGSTERAARLGDRRWRAVLDEFDVNAGRLLARHDGLLVKNTGDGLLARFDSPAQAVRCAVALAASARDADLELRAGLHAGEVELRGDDIGGLAVHIASRVSDMAGPDEVLVTGTVRDLVVGSGIVFDDRGRHNLKGVPQEWQVLAVEQA
jgi:class 3 adenylate cyclase